MPQAKRPQAKRPLRKSVVIEADVLAALSPAQKRNLSATVNDSLRTRAALVRQLAAVARYERSHGKISEEELAPFLESTQRAQVAASRRKPAR